MASRNNKPTEEEAAKNPTPPAPSGADKPAGDSAGNQQSQKSFPAYVESAARLPSSRPLGADIPKSGYIGGLGSDKLTKREASPGVIAYDFVPTYGVSVGPTSALNRAAFNEFNSIRSQISGNRPYEPADHMIYRMAVGSLRDLYSYMKRAYEILRTYQSTNLYRPRAIFTAMGLDFDSWHANAAQLYQDLLVRRSSLAPFPTVNVGNIDARRRVYNEVLYKDGEPECTQTYIINQKVFWSYEVVDEVKGLTAKTLPSTYEGVLALWDSMYAALQNSSDVYIIAADIRRAFGDAVLTDLPEISADGGVEYVKLDPILLGIMNASITNAGMFDPQSVSLEDWLTSFRIEDRDSALYCQPTMEGEIAIDYDFSEPRAWPINRGYLNAVSAHPTTSDIIHMVRFKHWTAFNFDWVTTTERPLTTQLRVTTMGTEFIIGARMVTYSNGVEETDEVYDGVLVGMREAGATSGEFLTDVSKIFRPLARLANFDWHNPTTLVLLNDREVSDTLTGADYTFEDVQNLIPITEDQLKQIHDAILLAEFGFQA